MNEDRTPHAGSEPGDGATRPANVTLVRGRHCWRLRCDAGGRDELLLAIRALVRREDSPLDAADGAVLAGELLGTLRPGLNTVPPRTDIRSNTQRPGQGR